MSEAEIHRNFDRLLETQNEISRRKNEAFVGKTVRVLVDGVSKTDVNTLSGRTEEGKIVNFQADPALTGRYAQVEITQAHTWSLNGRLIRAE